MGVNWHSDLVPEVQVHLRLKMRMGVSMKVAMSHTKSDLLRLAQFSCTSCGGHCAISKSRAKPWTTVMLSWTTKNLCIFFPTWIPPWISEFVQDFPWVSNVFQETCHFFVEDARLSVLKLFHALRWLKPRCWSKNTTGFTDDWTQQPGLATRWSCGRFRFWDFFVRRPCFCFFFGGVRGEGGKCSRTSGICELEVPCDVRGHEAIWQGFPPLQATSPKTRWKTLDFAERWWKRWIASGWLGVLPYVRTRAWCKNENKIALVIVSGPCDPSGIVM